MVGKRTSSRIAAMSSSPTSEKTSPTAGSKRKAEAASSPASKRGKKTQKTIEETMPDLEGELKDDDTLDESQIDDTPNDGDGQAGAPKNVEMKEANQVELDEKPSNNKPGKGTDEKAAESTQAKTEPSTEKEKGSNTIENGRAENGGGAATKSKEESGVKSTKGIEAADKERKEKAPSNIIEKGIIYFLTRGRVGIEEPDSVQDLQRTFFVLRPIPTDTKIGEGAIEDSKGNRLFALPKKVLPKSGKDRFMAFIEKSNVSMKELKEDFFKATEYETKTMGTRVTPHISPIGEGVYAITETGRNSHLAYMLTIPEKLDEVQEDMGLREKGSFIMSLKNPTIKGPAYASLDAKPEYPQEMIDGFRGLSWMPIHESKYLDYPNAQILLIGEGQDKFGAAVEATEADKKKDKETPQEELEKLENEDQLRVEHLHGLSRSLTLIFRC
jgi:hypothetical protein